MEDESLVCLTCGTTVVIKTEECPECGSYMLNISTQDDELKELKFD
jgi:rRNA maturation endonuclease Nob1